ncbi:MAG: TetR/AcrR family transcriptional regulator [Acidimicrobiales bacterium]|nr:TetR/AcrR family transcriptional regulator [Acidimicrobiales bacterium]
MTVTRKRARKGEGELLREEILQATERLLLETGSEEAVSIRSVAHATGVTPPSIYRHFVDKTHLLFEVCARQFALLDDVIEEAVAGIDDPLEAMAARGRAYVRFGVEHPEHYRIMFMGPAYTTPDQWGDVLSTGSFAHLVDGIQRVVDAGLMPADTDPFTTALHVWANIHGLTSLLVARPDMPWPDIPSFVEEHLHLCLAVHLHPVR